MATETVLTKSPEIHSGAQSDLEGSRHRRSDPRRMGQFAPFLRSGLEIDRNRQTGARDTLRRAYFWKVRGVEFGDLDRRE